MIYVVWGVLLCVIILNTHISKYELIDLNKQMEKATYKKPPKEGFEEYVKGMTLDTKTYIKIGRKQATIGTISVIVLLFMMLTKPYGDYIPNSILMVINGIIGFAMIGYTVEGCDMWWNSNESLDVDGGGEETNCLE